MLDAGVVGVGPWAATILGFLGANVIKVEAPSGDRIRQQPPLQGGLATTYSVVNLNKRAATIDVKQETNRPAIDRLIRETDVVIDNQRPAVMERLGLNWESVRALNPSVVSASSSAWGEQGPMRDLPALDYHVQMMSGYASLNGRPEDPGQLLRYPHLDFNSSVFLAAATLLGLIARERTGQGQRVKTTHLGSSIGLLITRFAEYFATSSVPGPMGSMGSATAPNRAFKCQDGKYVLVGVEDDAQFGALCKVVRRTDLESDPRFTDNSSRVSHRAELDELMAQMFMSKPSRWWILSLEKESVPCGTVKGFDDLRFHEQVVANKFLVTIASPTKGCMEIGKPPWDFSRTPAQVGHAPQPGEHTEQVLGQGFGRLPGSALPRPADLSEGQAPLSGVRVLEASQGLAGPFASLLLAEVGAEVVKVEPPGGDRTRRFVPACLQGDGAAFAALNRNKQTVELDLTTAYGQQAFRKLAASADVVIEDWGPGAAEDVDCGYGALAQHRDDLIYCSITAFGRKGPYRSNPTSELIAQGWTQYLQNLGAPGEPPERCGADIAGLGTGMMSFLGILAALYHKLRKPGEGQRVDVSWLGTMMFFKSALWAALSDPDAWEGDDYCNSEVKGRWYGYRAQDRPLYFNLNNCTEEQYLSLLDGLGMLDEALEDQRFANAGRDAVGLGRYAKEAQPVWERYFARKPASEVVDMINEHGGAAVPMLRLDEVFQHPQAATLNLLRRDSAGNAYVGVPWTGGWETAGIVPPIRCEDPNEVWAQA